MSDRDRRRIHTERFRVSPEQVLESTDVFLGEPVNEAGNRNRNVMPALLRPCPTSSPTGCSLLTKSYLCLSLHLLALVCLISFLSLCSLWASCSPGHCLLPERSRKEPAEQNGAALPALRPSRHSLHTLRCDTASQMLCRASYITHTLTHKCTPKGSNKMQFIAYGLQLGVTSRQSTFLSWIFK